MRMPWSDRFVAAILVTILTHLTAHSVCAADRVWIRGAGTGNWALGSNWSPAGVPQPGDSAFIIATDSFIKTVIFDGASWMVNNSYQTMWVDESGPGRITLQQEDLRLLALNLNVAIAGPGFYELNNGTGVFGNATLGTGNGAITVGPNGTLNATTFRQRGARLTLNGTMDCNTYIMEVFGGSFNHNGTYTGVNFTQNFGTINATKLFNLTGTYTYNSGVFTGVGGGVVCGTFINNAGTFGGSVDTGRLIQNGNGTFLNGVINRGPLNVPAGQTIWADQYFDQIGGTVTQSGFVVGDLPTIIGAKPSEVTIGGGATWAQLAGKIQGRSLVVGSGHGGPGVYSLSGTGSVEVSGLGVGAASDGTVLHSAGFVKANSIVLGGYAGFSRGGSPEPGKRGVYHLSGGSIQANGIALGPPESLSGTYIQSAGLAQFGQFLANTDNTSTAIVNIEGGSFVVNNDSTNGGSFSLTGGLAQFHQHFNGFGDLTVTGGLFMARRIRQDSMSLGGTGQIIIGGVGLSTSAFQSTTSRVKSLSFQQAGGTIQGTLDLNANRLVVDYDGASPAASIRQYIASGRAGGSWTGTGLTSSAAADPDHRTALGYAESSSLFGPSGGIFGGLVVDNTAVLIRGTYYGDADLDGDVDIADLGALASNWQSSGVWRSGDFDYSGFVDINDLGLLATNWQAGVGASLAPSLEEALTSLGLPGTSVPEPGALGIVALLGVLCAWHAGFRRHVSARRLETHMRAEARTPNSSH